MFKTLFAHLGEVTRSLDVMIALGTLGWVIGRFGFTASPIVLGLILGPIAESGFVQAWTIGGASGDRS